jgi:hypothetical protein
MSEFYVGSENQRLPILVQTIDGYHQEAILTANQLKASSLESFCDIYISINEGCREFSPPSGINIITRSIGQCWSSDLDESLQALNSEYVLFWLDDFVPTRIDNERLKSLWQWLQVIKGDYIRLNPTPKGGGGSVFDKVRHIDKGDSYRASTILAIWNVKFLRSILLSGESAWQFEFFGSVRSDVSSQFYASDTVTIDCVNLVVKGLIVPSEEKKLNELGVSTEMLKRSRMSTRQNIKLQLIILRSKIFEFIPSKIRRRLRFFFSTDLNLDLE